MGKEGDYTNSSLGLQTDRQAGRHLAVGDHIDRPKVGHLATNLKTSP